MCISFITWNYKSDFNLVFPFLLDSRMNESFLWENKGSHYSCTWGLRTCSGTALGLFHLENETFGTDFF